MRHKDTVRNTRAEQFDKSKDRLMADKNVEKMDTELRNKSLPHIDKDKTQSKIGQPIKQKPENEKGKYFLCLFGIMERK